MVLPRRGASAGIRRAGPQAGFDPSLEIGFPVAARPGVDLDVLWPTASHAPPRQGRDLESEVVGGLLWLSPQARRQPLVEAELGFLKALLRTYQRRFEEAFELLERPIALCRALGHPRLLAKSLIQAAKLHDYYCAHEAAIGALLEAKPLLDVRQDPYLVLSTLGNLAVSYAWAGDPGKALEVLPPARTLCESQGNRRFEHQLQRVEGVVQQELGDTAAAERLLRAARAGFRQLGELDGAAVAALELALHCLREGRLGEVVSLASEALCLFQRFQNDLPDALAAWKLLREAIVTDRVTLAVLEQAQQHLTKILRDPAVDLSAKEGPG